MPFLISITIFFTLNFKFTNIAVALPNFNRINAIEEWVKNSSNDDMQEIYFQQEFKYGTPLALESLLTRSNKWTLIKKVNYQFGYAAPIEERIILAKQQPKIFKSLSPDATYYLHLTSNPEIHLVLKTETSFFLGEGGISSKILFLQKNLNYASQLQTELTDELLNNSGYRGGALELTQLGLLQFLPRVEDYNATWDQLILNPETKSSLIEGIDGFLKNYDYEKWKNLGIAMSQGVLIYGPPGTGKSFLGKILISNLLKNRYQKSITYFHIQSRHISDLYQVRLIFNLARKMSPSVLYIEDIDLIAGTDRSNRPEIKNEFMQQLSGIEELNGVLTIGTTNVPEQIDPALKRSKRLGLHFNFGLPSFSERKLLLETFVKPYARENFSMDSISAQTEGFTGADLKQLCLSAIDFAITDMKSTQSKSYVLTEEHLKKSLELRKKTRLMPIQKLTSFKSH